MKAEYLNHYGTDADIAHYARQSFGKRASEYTDEQNANLIRYLARGMSSGDYDEMVIRTTAFQQEAAVKFEMEQYRRTPTHWVPFSHPHITLAMQAPVPIARQCFKHKIGLTESEESRRYIKSEPVLYVPDQFRAAAENVKQGSGAAHTDSDGWLTSYKAHCQEAIRLYLMMVADGVCPEQARFILPQGVEVHWVWTGSLYAFANFVIQRRDSHAQQEIQDLAEQVDAIIRPLFPIAWPALVG